MRHRLEYTATKMWAIKQDGTSVLMKSGKKGGKATTIERSFDSEDKAREFAEEQLKIKLDHSYVTVAGDPLPDGMEEKAKKETKTKTKTKTKKDREKKTEKKEKQKKKKEKKKKSPSPASAKEEKPKKRAKVEHPSDDEETSDQANIFEGRVFFISGKLVIPKDEMEEMIVSAGGTLVTNLTKKVDYLLTSDPTSLKAEEARGQGSQVVDEEWVLVCIEAGAIEVGSGEGTGSEGMSDDPKSDESDDDSSDDQEQLSDKLAGKVICVSGRLNMKKSDLEKLIVQHGGEVALSVTKKMNCLVCTDTTSVKAEKARAQGAEVVDEDWLMEAMAE